MTSPQKATDKRAALQKQMAALEAEIAALDQEVVHELKLKLSDARKVVRDLEEELSRLTGKSEGTGKITRERKPAISDEALQPQVFKVMANFGKEGMNAIQLAEKLHQNPLRIRKFISSNPKTLKRIGNGPGTKFFLP